MEKWEGGNKDKYAMTLQQGFERNYACSCLGEKLKHREPLCKGAE